MFHRGPSSSMNRKQQIILNVYDLHGINDYLYPIGLGVFHSGVEISGVTEFSFGGADYNVPGIFEYEPKEAPECTFREMYIVGETHLSISDIRRITNEMKKAFMANEYSLVFKNCNHFSELLVSRLTGTPIPGYVNRLAYMGSWIPTICMPNILINTPQAMNNSKSTDKPEAETEPLIKLIKEDPISYEPFGGTGYILETEKKEKKEDLIENYDPSESEADRRQRIIRESRIAKFSSNL